MPLQSIGSGPGSNVGDMVAPCKAPVTWTIQAKDHNLRGDPSLANANLLVSVDGTEPQSVTSDRNGLIHLVFDPEENLADHQVTIVHAGNRWKGQPTAPRGIRASKYRFQSDALLAGTWKLRVRVWDATPDTAVLISRSKIVVDGINAQTGEGENAFSKDGLVCENSVVIRIPAETGALTAKSAAFLTIGDGEAFQAGANATRDGVTVSRDNTNVVTVAGIRDGVEVTVEFRLKFAWKVSIEVKDRRPKGVAGDPIALRGVPLEIKTDGGTVAPEPKTAADGKAFAKNDLETGVKHTISVPDGFGALLDQTEVTIKVNDEAVAPVVKGDAIVKGKVEVARPDHHQVTVHVKEGTASITLEFKMRYPTIFIVGEGEQWGYALGLARKYAKGDADAVRNRDLQPNNRAPATTLSDLRKWVIASQYDVTAAPTVHVPSNLKVYRDASGPGGQFDVRNRDCWTRLKASFDLFEAMAFNNPHPGYGVHKGTVFGLESASGRSASQGRYICVHSIGWDNKLTPQQVTLFRNYRDGTGGVARFDMTTAANQKYFLQTDVGCVTDGTDRVPSFADDGSVALTPIDSAFMPVTGVTDDATLRTDPFSGRVTHYRAQIDTVGLWQSILRCYRLNGLSALKVGGAMYVNGSDVFDSERGHGQALEGFSNEGGWPAGHNTYYANYLTNFTSTRFHPSYFHNVRFNPGEPNLNDARAYKLARAV